MDKILSMIGLATRAGQTASGEFSVETAISKGNARLVFISSESSENTLKKFRDKCSFYKVPFYVGYTKQELGKVTGKEVRTLIAITDDNFAGAINKLIGEQKTEEE